MEIFSLQVGDKLMIGDTQLVVKEKTKNSVKLGFVAPSDINICRQEAMAQYGNRRAVFVKK